MPDKSEIDQGANKLVRYMEVSGMTSVCYPLLLRMMNCFEKEYCPRHMCYIETSDYMECYRGDKETILNEYLEVLMRRFKVITIPTYDEKTNTFTNINKPKKGDNYF